MALHLEKDIIESIRQKTLHTGEIPGLGIGDDAAYLTISSMEHNKLVIASDSLVEGVHFRLDWCSAGDVAAKLFEINASDLLVKGAVPAWALLVMNITPEFAADKKGIDLFTSELADKFRIHKVALIGGDITASATNTFTLTLFASSQYFTPRKAEELKIGDILVISGQVGGSSYAQSLFEEEKPADESVLSLYRRPEARWENRWLHELSAKASIDQSDTLHETFVILAEQNHAALEINLDRIPLAPPLQVLSDADKISSLLTGAEDLAQVAILPAGVEGQLERYSLVKIGQVGKPGKPEIIYKGFSGEPVDITDLSFFNHFE
ncbi:MAG: AIR synthase related protein [Leptospirales bacterium]